jgi:hypothetical protein
MARMAINTPGFTGASGDPGMVTRGNITISLPNINRVNQEDIASLVDRMREEERRQGRQVV